MTNIFSIIKIQIFIVLPVFKKILYSRTIVGNY